MQICASHLNKIIYFVLTFILDYKRHFDENSNLENNLHSFQELQFNKKKCFFKHLNFSKIKFHEKLQIVFLHKNRYDMINDNI